MKRLNELYDCNYDVEINRIIINSKDIEPGDLFICTMGVTADRHDYVNDAVEKGAAAIVASKPIDVPVPVIYVEDTKTSIDKVYAGGDAVTGAATVILAMEAGKKAAKEIMNALL
jgi:UDP-N-acetylmuramyl pentapeptide synthase